MTTSRTIPPNRLGKAYRVLLVCAALLGIVGIGFSVRTLIWLALHRGTDSDTPTLDVAKAGLRLVAWCFITYAGYTGWRRDTIPATWILVSIAVVGWALLGLQWYEG